MDATADVIDEFYRSLNDAGAVLGILRSSLPFTLRQLARFARVTQMRQEDLIHLTAIGRTSSNGPGDAYAAWPLKRLPENLANDGAIARQAGQQWVISVYHLWEDRFREEIAMDRGLNEKSNLQNKHMGDLAKIRHDILKCRGIATRKNSGKCVELKWFEVGDEVFIQDWMVYEFMEAFGLVYPGSGHVDPDRVRYKFHGIVQSPVRFRAETADDLLFGEIRSLSGRPIQLDKLRELFKDRELYVDGPGGGGTARGVDVFPIDGDNKAATLVAYAGRNFVQQVREGGSTADLPFGASVPRLETRRAVPTRWTRGSEVVAEALAPADRWYDLEPFEREIGSWLPLVSDTGDMYEGQLRTAAHGSRDRRRLLLTLTLDEAVATHLKGRRTKLFAPLDLHN